MAKNTNPWRETPLIQSTALSRAAHCTIHLKLENLQPSGSFKSRGIGHYMQKRLHHHTTSPSTSPVHFYSSSGGNAGLAAVAAARTLGAPCTVVVPQSTTPLMKARIKAAGAHAVIQRGASWADADRFLREELLTADQGGVYVPPFDDGDVWAGHAGMVREMRAQWGLGKKEPAAVVCSVGGGGLLCGLLQGLVEVGWEGVPVVAVETEGAASLAASLRAGRLVTLERITSRARCLGAVRVAERAFEMARERDVRSVVLSDAEAALGCWRLADDHRFLVELACGVNVAMCYGGHLEKALGRELTVEDEVIVVLCGGSDITIEELSGMRREFGWVEEDVGEQTAARPQVPSDLTAPNGTNGTKTAT